MARLRVVLLGRTGVGKSSSGNTILGIKDGGFKADGLGGSSTGKCEKMTKQFKDDTVVLVDTPGFFHTGKSHGEVMEEMLQIVELTEPGPHVFLLVLSQEAFTRKDKDTLEAFKKAFQDAEPYTIVLFTHGDQDKVEAFIESKPDLKKFISECGGRYHVFDNESENDSQVTGLLEKIKAVVQNHDRNYYNKGLYEKANILKSESKFDAQFITKCFTKLYKGVAGNFEIPEKVRGFLSLVQEIAYHCMPSEAKQ